MFALEAVEKSALESAVFAIFKNTGLRCGDVASLRWASVDWANKTLRVLTAKRSKRVEVPMNREFVRIMDDFRIEGEDRVFPGMVPHKLYQMVREWGEESGVENSHPHRFRHSRACWLLKRGLTLYEVAQLLGDSCAVTEKYYAKWTPEHADKVRALLGD